MVDAPDFYCSSFVDVNTDMAGHVCSRVVYVLCAFDRSVRSAEHAVWIAQQSVAHATINRLHYRRLLWCRMTRLLLRLHSCDFGIGHCVNTGAYTNN